MRWVRRSRTIRGFRSNEEQKLVFFVAFTITNRRRHREWKGHFGEKERGVGSEKGGEQLARHLSH